MKSIFTLLFVLFCGVAAVANTGKPRIELKPQIEKAYEIKFSKMVNNLDSGIVVATKFNEVKATSETEMVRLYKFKNSRIKKALKFTTKRNKAKMA